MTGGGAERVLLNIAKKLYYENYEVELVVVNLEGSFVAEVEYGIKVHDLKIKSIKKAAFPLLRLFRQKKPKLIFSTLGYVNLLIILMKDVMIFSHFRALLKQTSIRIRSCIFVKLKFTFENVN